MLAARAVLKTRWREWKTNFYNKDKIMFCERFTGILCRFDPTPSLPSKSESNCKYGTLLFWSKDEFNRICAVIREQETGRCRTVVADNIWIDIEI